MTKDNKRQKVEEIYKEQLSYLKKSVAVAKLPEPKRPSTSFKRAFRVLAYAMKVSQLEMQKRMVIATPINEGLVSGGVAIIGEPDKEMVINRDGKVFNFSHPNKHIVSSEAQKQACNLCNVSGSASKVDTEKLIETIRNIKPKKN